MQPPMQSIPNTPQFRPEDEHRPSKRPRQSDVEVVAEDLPGRHEVHSRRSSQPMQVGSKRRTRGITACQTCRSRKTKCDNEMPSCGYCTRVGAQCIYLDADSSPHSYGHDGQQLLAAMEELTRLLQAQTSRQAGIEQSLQQLLVQGTSSSTPRCSPQPPPHVHIQHQSVAFTSKGIGLDSVLSWPIFSASGPYIIPLVTSCNVSHTYPLPSLHLSDLLRLEGKFLANVHPKNPIIDPAGLREHICHLAENGPDWSPETCLVALVCALGAYSQAYQLQDEPQQEDGNISLSSKRPDSHSDSVARGFWGIAVKRLGIVIGQESATAIQCLNLAGVWHMYNLEPLQAWRYFNLASNSWYMKFYSIRGAVDSTRNAFEIKPQGTWTVEQTLYFSCLKSECELKFELALPPSSLEDTDYPYTFPEPPDSQSLASQHDGTEKHEQAWYYYLAEIASWHLTKRIVEAYEEAHKLPLIACVERLLADSEIFHAQLRAWQASLPPTISFAVPCRSMDPVADELIQHLRGRYLIISELIHRPFVRLCTSFTLDVHPEIVTQIARLASQGLQICALRLRSTRVTRHHGSWFQLRNFVSCAMMLVAAEKSQSESTANVASMLRLPQGWRTMLLEKREQLSVLMGDERGGIATCGRILDSALREFVEGYNRYHYDALPEHDVLACSCYQA